jgi:hypothetical protein
MTMKMAKQITEAISDSQLQQDPATARLEATLGKEFKFVDQRVFSARRVTLVGASEKPLHIRIAGAKPSTGKVLMIENTANPNNLQITAEEGILQSEVDAGVLFVPKGETVITADRTFQPLQDLDSAKKETLVRLPSKDPDKVTMDGRVFLQTGTVCVQGQEQGMFIVLGEENRALGGD